MLKRDSKGRFCPTRKRNPKAQREIAFTADKKGRPIAYKVNREINGFVHRRIAYDEAKLLVATGQAREVPYHPNPKQPRYWE